MNKKMMSQLNLKAVCSVAEVIKQVGLSRARFYQLMAQGFFPNPVYDIFTRRAFYTLELQLKCQEVRESNIGWPNQRYILFYSPRKPKIETETATAQKRKQPKADKTFQEFADTLASMGISVGTDQIGTALSELYPDGINKDHGSILRDLYKFFKNRG